MAECTGVEDLSLKRVSQLTKHKEQQAQSSIEKLPQMVVEGTIYSAMDGVGDLTPC